MVNEVSDRITTLISEQLGVNLEEVVPTASIVDDLGADSLDEVELVMSLEEMFGLDITDDEASKLKTVSQYVDFVNEKTKPRT
jgi:acyl carrier protein